MNETFRLRMTNRMFRGQYRLNLDIPKVIKLALAIRA